jgi:hypothetical protein
MSKETGEKNGAKPDRKTAPRRPTKASNAAAEVKRSTAVLRNSLRQINISMKMARDSLKTLSENLAYLQSHGFKLSELDIEAEGDSA